MKAFNEKEESMRQDGQSDPILRMLERSNLEVTRENYLMAMFNPDNPPNPLPAEYEAMLPKELQKR